MGNGNNIPTNQKSYSLTEIQKRIDFVKNLDPKQPIKLNVFDNGKRGVIEKDDEVQVQYLDRKGKVVGSCEKQKVTDFIYRGDCNQIGLVEPQGQKRNMLWSHRATKSLLKREPRIKTFGSSRKHVLDHTLFYVHDKGRKVIARDARILGNYLMQSFLKGPLTFTSDRAFQMGVSSLGEYYKMKMRDFLLWEVLVPAQEKLDPRAAKNDPIRAIVVSLKLLTNEYLQVNRSFPTEHF